MSLFPFCTVCARLIKIFPVSWLHDEGRTLCKWSRPSYCLLFTGALYLWELYSYYFLGKGHLVRGWLLFITTITLASVHLWIPGWSEGVWVYKYCALRQHYITTATLWWETERKQQEKEEKNPGADYMGTSGHKIDRTEGERSSPKKPNKKKHDCRYNSKPPSTQLQRQGTKLPSPSSSLACIGLIIIKIPKIQDLERNTVHIHQSIKHMYDQGLTLLTYCKYK